MSFREFRVSQYILMQQWKRRVSFIFFNFIRNAGVLFMFYIQ